jgi:hypothetical protein
MVTHREFLNKFGPAKNAADEFHVSIISINHWKSRGIPPAYWLRALQLATKHDFPLHPDDLILTSPSKRVQVISDRNISKNDAV